MTFLPEEVDSLYTEERDRFVVSLIITWDPRDGVMSKEEAVQKAVLFCDPTTLDGPDTYWYVFDRATRKGEYIVQGTVFHEFGIEASGVSQFDENEGVDY